jgi:hypothetical protein
MSRRRTGLTSIAVVVLVAVSRAAVAQDPAPVGPGRRPHIFLTGMARLTVARALRGAMQRLWRPECQQVFEDFTDRTGRALTTSLGATAESPADVLAGLYFVDGDDTVRCRTDRLVAAFTTPGSRVIHVCGRQFIKFANQSKPGEILLIHELLHSLGLGENPPTSSRITAAVMSRCG